jgi:hypothetical protein
LPYIPLPAFLVYSYMKSRTRIIVVDDSPVLSKCAILLIVLLCFSAKHVQAQEEDSKVSVDLSAEIVSRYIWRGMNLSSSPAVQPTLSLNAGNFSIGSWGSYTFSPELFQEVDLFLTYSTKYISLTINDYYNPLDTIGFTGDYFHFGNEATRHSLEGMLTLNGPESFHLSLTAGVMFYGNDKNAEGNNMYSTYIELSYAAQIRDIEIKTFAGMTPAEGYYGQKAGIVNLGITATKNLTITDNFHLPLKGSFIINPQTEKVFFVIGIIL